MFVAVTGHAWSAFFAVLSVFVLAQHPTALQMLAILVVTGSVLVEMFWPRITRALGLGAE